MLGMQSCDYHMMVTCYLLPWSLFLCPLYSIGIAHSCTAHKAMADTEVEMNIDGGADQELIENEANKSPTPAMKLEKLQVIREREREKEREN